VDDLDITPNMAKVLKIFLEDPGQPRYGLELMRATRVPSGTMYPLLARLEKAEWLTKGREDIDPRTEGRPPRLHYTITGAAITAARLQLAALSRQYAPPAPRAGRTEPRGNPA
jgi:PadR family transcriptional regulator, regulatory protein PadR